MHYNKMAKWCELCVFMWFQGDTIAMGHRVYWHWTAKVYYTYIHMYMYIFICIYIYISCFLLFTTPVIVCVWVKKFKNQGTTDWNVYSLLYPSKLIPIQILTYYAILAVTFSKKEPKANVGCWWSQLTAVIMLIVLFTDW